MLETVSTSQIILAVLALFFFSIIIFVINNMINNRDNFDLPESEQDRIWKKICKELDFKDEIENETKKDQL